MAKQTMHQPNLSEQGYHIPVLLNECIEALQIKPAGVYVDCTFGGGGHSRGILNALDENGKLIVFDQDEDAKQNIPNDDRLIFVPHNFRHLQRFLKLHGFDKVDGVLADLGVSSHQFDEGSRGFSIRFDGPLDMRMDVNQPLTAEKVLKTYTELQLHKMFEQYGEVTNAKTLAKHIVQQREVMPLQTIQHFKNMLFAVVKGNPNKYLAQVFQSVRIEVNDELGALKEMLQQLNTVVKPGGRVAIITFHSLEDRLVKNFFKTGSVANNEPENPFEVNSKEKVWLQVNKKPILATTQEQKTNKRSTSAKLRVAQKI